MISPCVRICTMDVEAGLCEGCGRTLDEIAGWVRMDEAGRQAIMAALPARLEAKRRSEAEGALKPRREPIWRRGWRSR
jgi:hypothetical protein